MRVAVRALVVATALVQQCESEGPDRHIAAVRSAPFCRDEPASQRHADRAIGTSGPLLWRSDFASRIDGPAHLGKGRRMKRLLASAAVVAMAAIGVPVATAATASAAAPSTGALDGAWTAFCTHLVPDTVPERPAGDTRRRWERPDAALRRVLATHSFDEPIEVPAIGNSPATTIDGRRLLPMLSQDVLNHAWDLARAVGAKVPFPLRRAPGRPAPSKNSSKTRHATGANEWRFPQPVHSA